MAPRFLLLLALFSTLILPAAHANVVDRSVAVVNDDTITLSEVNEFGRPYFQKVTEKAPPAQLAEALQQARTVVINKLIDRKLMVQEAKKLGVQVTDQEIDNAQQRVLENNKITMEEFRKELVSMDTTEALYREELRDQILSSKLINHEVRTKVVIPEEKILDFYDTHFTEQAGGAYAILQIGCLWGTTLASGATPTQAEARDKAEKLRKLAAKGEDFKDLAKKYSDLPSAADGGDLGTFEQDEMASFMRDAVIKLQPGEVSQVVENDNGYYVFKLVSSKAGERKVTAPYAEVKDQIREKLAQEAMEQRFKDWMQSIRDKAYIKIL